MAEKTYEEKLDEWLAARPPIDLTKRRYAYGKNEFEDAIYDSPRPAND